VFCAGLSKRNWRADVPVNHLCQSAERLEHQVSTDRHRPAVPEGQVPSTGMRLTGIWSPSPSNIRAVNCRTNSGGAGRHRPRPPELSSALPQFAHVASTASKFRCTTSSPLEPWVFRMDSLIWTIAWSRGSTPERTKNQVCSTVLARFLSRPPGRPDWRR